jgi:hypothetical protein
MAFDDEDRARFVGVFAIILVTYVLGFVDGRSPNRVGHRAVEKQSSAAI